MTKKKKTVEVIFAPGCFDAFDGTQEELDELVNHIKGLAESGELAEHGKPLDEDAWDELTPEEQAILSDAISDMDPTRKLQ